MNPVVGIYSDSYPDKRMILNKVLEVQYIQIENKRETIGRALRFLGRTFPGIRQTEFYAQGVHFTLDAPYYPNNIPRVFQRGEQNQLQAHEETVAADPVRKMHCYSSNVPMGL